MRPSSYIIGMFTFDMLISIISGVAMVVFANQANLSQFKGAPISLLVMIVVLSAFALNAGALLLVKSLGKRSSVLPMVAPCLCIAATAATSLLNVMVYTDDGDWPWYLSIVPFFAQGRALYIVLVYHTTSSEVDIAFSFLALFGAVSLVLVYILEANIPVIAIVRNFYNNMTQKNSHTSNGDDDENVLSLEASPMGSSMQSKDLNSEKLDDDVAAEMQRALSYQPSVLRQSIAARAQPLSLETPAIVIQALRHVWPNGTVGVEDLSLTMSYGECFGKYLSRIVVIM